MPNPIQTTTLTCLLVLLPLVASAQTCNTAITASTPTSRFIIKPNGTVLDKYTGLLWKTCAEGNLWNARTHACDYTADTFTWQGSLQQAQKHNLSGGFAKFKDWRVPNQKELYTLVAIQCYQPAINLKVFPNTDTDAAVWSSSPNAGNSYYAWGIDFSNGSVNNHHNSSTKQVRLVRGEQ
ncbi:conserved exported hypothetical protein [Crenothrix polyspora]|uniref:Lcl C-terminal domain-containing protein n=1 Tax=Crenothrix polyspora TaxID=360316 RepID=A0A1R4HD21_9GAMM|nr:DUF1566 domain-containing protein [Crenothrix polyspora]SJM94148.1 conserved exported hypothetical protein [Crenothrix polyspora]